MNADPTRSRTRDPLVRDANHCASPPPPPYQSQERIYWNKVSFGEYSLISYTLYLSSPRLCFFIVIMPPLFVECGRALSVAHVRASVRACVCASVRPSFKWVLCERNSSYNFIRILLKLYRCFCQGLKMCMTFGYNPQINFSQFFHSLNLVIFWAQLLLKLMDIRYLVSATPPTFFPNPFETLQVFLSRTEDVHDIWI